MSKPTMTVADFEQAFPWAICLRRCERGPHKARAMGWYVTFTGDYFTSDSDRLSVDRSEPPDFAQGWGETIEEALGDLAARQLSNAELQHKWAVDTLARKERELAEMRTKVQR